jgi:hypothetical protein
MWTSKDLKRRLELQKTPEGLKQLAREHWKEHRPTMYRDMEESGRLESALKSAVEVTLDAMKRTKAQLVENGYTPSQADLTAWELLREEWILLPSEEDMPLLGESPEDESMLDILASKNPPRTLEIEE